MTDFQSPDVSVAEKRGTPVSFSAVSPGVPAFMGITEQGPVNVPVRVYGIDDAQEVFGDFIPESILLDEVNAFFKQGGESCYISRVSHYTDPNDETSNTALAAQTVLTNGTDDTLNVSASSPGLFGNLLRVSVLRVDTVVGKVAATTAGARTTLILSTILRITVGDTISITKAADTQRAVVTSVDPVTKSVTLSNSITVPAGGYDGTENVLNETTTIVATKKDGVTKYTYRNLRMSPLAGADYVENKINNTARSPIIVEDLSLPVEDDNRPANQSNTLLGVTTAGVNSGAVVDADYVGSKAGRTGLYAFDDIDDFLLGPLVPGITTVDVLKGIEAYLEERQDVFTILDLPQGLTPSEAVTFVQSTAGISTSYAAVYYPWLRAPDYRTGGPSSFPPSGYVAGVFARTFRRRNYAKAPAGIEDGRILGVTGLDTEVKKPAYDQLYPARINAIQRKKGRGFCVMGARTLDSLGDFSQIPTRIVFLVVKRYFKEATQFALFETSNTELWNRITRVLTLYLRGLRESGILQGSSDEEAFFVQCNADNNTPFVRKSGRVRCRVGLNVGDTTEFVEITLEQDTRALDAELAAEVG
jgi:uncharacterized protein